MDNTAVRHQSGLVPVSADEPHVRRFGPWSYVQDAGEKCLVVARGALIGSFDKADDATRNVLLVAAYQSCKRGEVRALVKAFGVSPGTLWNLRDAFDRGGAAALVGRSHGGVRHRRLTEGKQQRADRLFDSGATVSQVARATGLSHGSAVRARKVWQEHLKQPAAPASSPVVPEEELEIIDAHEPQSASQVQHAGTWLLVAMAASLGLHELASDRRPANLKPGLLRLALDSFVAALAIGDRCVEGVRRLGTASAGALLLSAHAPSASWVRRVLHRFADAGNGSAFHFSIAGHMARAAAEGEDVAVFYVDNHLRPYSGRQVLRKGWRMQDRSAVPGTSDFYVHDEDGRPVFRVDSPGHASLAAVLKPVAAYLRIALGNEIPVVLAFDRGGSFPEAMAELRDAGIGFVTYERRPYALLAQREFDRSIVLEGDERVGVCEPHDKNLGQGRGRVRRICLRMEDGHQVNLLAVSALPVERLVEIISGRWRQENAFKHGKERWGINQLDGRRCEPFPEGTIIPNPARRRLEHALELVRRWEGDVRNRLARVGNDEKSRERLTAQLNEAVSTRGRHESHRPSLPTHAPVEETELAGKLVRHEPDYKMALDAVRTVCANAEAELAALLGPHLPKPEEAKRILRSLFASPGRIEVGPESIRVLLQPSGSRSEIEGLAQFCELLDRNWLTHPGDPGARKLEFRVPTDQEG